MPFLRVPVCFVKKETVKGMSGKTHGVNKAMNPPINPRIKMLNSPLSAALSSPESETGLFKSKVGIRILALFDFPPSRDTANEKGISGKKDSPIP